MERPTALTRAVRAFAILTAATATWGAPAVAAMRWTAPARIGAASSLEVLGPQIAVSAGGAAAVSFDEVNLDAQATASAFVAVARAHGPFRAATAVGPNVQEVLGLAFSGSTLELMTASSPVAQPCCTVVQVTRLEASGAFGPPQTLVANVGGGAIGRLVPLADGRMLAVIAGPERLWVAQARGAGRFGSARALTPAGVAPVALAVAGTPAGGSTVVWTEGSGQKVLVASGGSGRTPSRPRTLLAVPAGHHIDGVQLAPLLAGLTVGWTESWNGSSGVYHSRAMAAELPDGAGTVRPRALSAPGAVASALALAGDGQGHQVAAWDACSSSTCTVEGTVRSAGGRWFGADSRLGPIDPGQTPLVAMAPKAGGLAGWITGGHAVLAVVAAGSSRFGALRPVSGSLAGNLDLGFGPAFGPSFGPAGSTAPTRRARPKSKAAVPPTAVATWTQGTSSPSVFAAVTR